MTNAITVAKKGNFYAVLVDGKEVRCLGSRKAAKEVAAQIELKSAYDAYLASKPDSLGVFQSPAMLRSLGII